MRKSIVTFLAIPFLATIVATSVEAQPVDGCIRVDAIRGAVSPMARGVLRNTCDFPIGVIFGFDKKYDGSTDPSWCRFNGDYGNEHAPGTTSQIFEPEEQQSVGFFFDDGVSFNVLFAACRVDTSANTSLNFIMSPPIINFDGSCGYTCE